MTEAIDYNKNGNDFQHTHPASFAEVVVPHNTTNLSSVSRAIYVGVGGDVNVVMFGSDAQILFKGVPTGALLPIRVKRVLSTSTTATDMVSLR